jgi:hypothetical protein
VVLSAGCEAHLDGGDVDVGMNVSEMLRPRIFGYRASYIDVV